MDGQAASPSRLYRVGWARLASSPSKTGNVDISPSGSILVLTDDAVYVVHLADGVAPFLHKYYDNHVQLHRDAARSVPLFQSTISIASTLDGANVTAGPIEGVDLMSFDSRFIHAEWAPYEWGPLGSPVFAALTTKRTLHIFHATSNYLRGPWKEMEGSKKSRKHRFSAFSWAPSSPDAKETQMWIVGGSTDGNLVLQRIEKRQGELHFGKPIEAHQFSGAIYSLACSAISKRGSRWLAVATTDGLFVGETEGMEALKDSSFSELSKEILGKGDAVKQRIIWMRWFGTSLIYCTAGQMHHFDASSLFHGTAFLSAKNEEKNIESYHFQPPAEIAQRETGWQLTMQDGTIFFVEEPITYNFEAPCGEVEIPVDELAEMQREVERRRGLFGCRDDGSGLTILCFDGNEIAAWSYYLNKQCFLDFALSQAPTSELDAETVTHIVQEQLQLRQLIELDATDGDSDLSIPHIKSDAIQQAFKRRRFLALRYADRSRRQQEVLSACLDTLTTFTNLQSLRFLRPHDAHTLTQIALMFTCWCVQAADVFGAELKLRAEDVSAKLMRTSAQALIKSPAYEAVFAIDKRSAGADGQVERQCLILAASALVASDVEERDGSTDAGYTRIVQNVKGEMYGNKLLKEWIRLLQNDKELDLGELCPACEAPVTMGKGGGLFHSTCKNGHRWRRCSTTRTLLTQIQALQCVICTHQCMLLKDATNDLQRAMLQSVERCTLCGGAFVLI